MAERGAAALSLGEIARRLGLSTPALYRYFPSRDALVHALARDAYAELADVSAAAAARMRGHSFAERFRALVDAYRHWALTHDQDYVLIHGAVFPGCAVPDELIRPEVARTLRLFVELLDDARRAGGLRLPHAYDPPPDAVRRAIAPMAEALGGVDAPLVLLAYTTWLPVHALVWEQVRGHAPDLFDPDAFFAMEMDAITERLGLTRAPPRPVG